MKKISTNVSVLMMALLFAFPALRAQEKPAIKEKRTNELAKLYPGGFGKLSPASKKIAWDYGQAWSDYFAKLGASGSGENFNVKEYYEKTLLSGIAPLRSGTAAEQKVFLAAEKVYEVIDYSFSGNRTYSDAVLNRLIRYAPGNENDPVKMVKGLREFMADYFQLVDPDQKSPF